jgi:hypothetical protein
MASETNKCLLFIQDRVESVGFLGRTAIDTATDTEFTREFSGNEFAIKDRKRTEMQRKSASPMVAIKR